MRLVKLHRSRACSAPYLPSPPHHRRSHPSALPDQQDDDAPYSRFAYADCGRILADLESDLRCLQDRLVAATTTSSSAAPGSASASPSDDAAEAAAAEWSIQFVLEREVRRAASEKEQEEELRAEFAGPGRGMRQPLPPALLWKGPAPAEAAAITKEAAGIGIGGDEGEASAGGRNSSPDRRRPRGGSAASAASSSAGGDGADDDDASAAGGASEAGHGTTRRRQPRQGTGGGAMYLDPSGEEHVFYQADDGRLCFLSPFNVKCLQREFSTHPPAAPDPDSGAAKGGRDGDGVLPPPHQHQAAARPGSVRPCPLPDAVEGAVLDVERVVLTPDVRQRLRFLSHLPLLAEVQLVEIDLGRVLSRETKSEHGKEFRARRRRAAEAARSERRERDRDRRREQERIEELKSRYRSVDPSDPFFRPVLLPPPPPELDATADGFGPRLAAEGEEGDPGGATAAAEAAAPPPADTPAAKPALSFSQMVRRGGTSGAGAGSGPGALRVDEFPALGSLPPASLPPPPPPPRVWGGRSEPKQLAAGDSASAGAEAADGPVPSSLAALEPCEGGGRKKKKGLKVVLFSTGGQRGMS
jgi:hypothetical protein